MARLIRRAALWPLAVACVFGCTFADRSSAGSNGATSGDDSSATGSAESAGSSDAATDDADTGTGETSAGTDDGDWVDPGCDDPVEIVVNGAPSGQVRCADGSINRTGSGDWAGVGQRLPKCDPSTFELDCETDADCTEGTQGECSQIPSQVGGSISCACTYACATDDDCEPGTACVWSTDDTSLAWPSCRPAQCRTGDDCTSGECGLFVESICGVADSWNLVCRDQSTCRVDDDCPAGDDICQASSTRPELGWYCDAPNTCPF